MIPFLHRIAHKNPEDNPLWLVVLSDIMTNLMLFFLIMYVFSLQPEEMRASFYKGFQEKSLSESKEAKAEKVIQKFKEEDAAETIKDQLKKSKLKDMADVEITDRQIRVKMQAPILFRSGEAGLNENAKTALDPLGAVLLTLNNDFVVEGHTDSIPIGNSPYKTNWELSVGRADSVIEYFFKKYSIPQERFLAAAYGEFRPLGDNKTKEGRARNRRIEIVILRK